MFCQETKIFQYPFSKQYSNNQRKPFYPTNHVAQNFPLFFFEKNKIGTNKQFAIPKILNVVLEN
jgi:hypothetical protein